MGIHGEPGLLEVDLPSANELADLMTARLLGERPLGLDSGPGTRLAVVLNGLGSVKGEELFVLYGRVAKLLDDAGITIVMAEVGELVTSFEMAGVSLTFSWLDADLEQLWIAAAGAPAFRRGNALEGSSADVGTFTTTETVMGSNPATPASADLARDVLQCLQAMKTALDANVDHLGRLDAIAGDGDHGIGMQRGSTAAVQSAERAVVEGSGAGTTLARAADAWSDKAGGTSGLLWGILLRELGEEFGDVDVPDLSAIARGISSGHREITRFGKAQLGDKTMVDVLVPVADSLTRSAAGGLGLIDAVTAAADVAESSAAATADLMPLIGRARPHAEKSVGTPDPGATSLALLVRTLQRTLINRKRTA
jgi:dihydroxyacetone kinase